MNLFELDSWKRRRGYVGVNSYVLQKGQLVLHGSGSIDLPTWDLSLRLGTLQN